MSYLGYRLKINGVTVPENHIARGSYSISANDRVIDEWQDADLVDHVSTINTRQHLINFSFREHDSPEHSVFIGYLSSTQDITVQYYDDLTDSYLTGSFHTDGVNFSHQTIRSGRIWYNETPVELKEY